MNRYTKNAEIIAKLTPEQYRVTQQSGTERPGTGEYLDNKEPGIYVDIVSGEPLFASSDKYESGCGWPSFTKPIEPVNINELRDTSHGMIRTEVRSTQGDSHLGQKTSMATKHEAMEGGRHDKSAVGFITCTGNASSQSQPPGRRPTPEARFSTPISIISTS